jgi:starch phosphorylase
MNDKRTVAYFSMEIGFHPDVPTYAGGLGILAGDTVRSAADLHVPMVALTLLHRKGYFYQRLDANGWQSEDEARWVIDDFLHDTDVRTEVAIEGRTVHLRIWQFDVTGQDGFVVPIYLLDADLPENADWDRTLTHYLYGDGDDYRLCQEVVLGIGGVRALRALGYQALERFHMNEGHAALLTIELLREVRTQAGRSFVAPEDLQVVHDRCVFTTHTPVPAGHDKFDLDLVDRVLGGREACGIHDPICHENRLNMTYLALSLSHYVNGVAKRHGEVSRHMFAAYKIDAITNGVHVATWVAPEFATLFDRYIPGWRQDNFSLRYALNISNDDVWGAHQKAKRRLLGYINRRQNAGLDVDVLTLGFARRVTAYKRGDLIFDDMQRLRRLSREVGRLQLVFAGKAHPRDEDGKRLIQRIIQTGHALAPDLTVTFIPNYDIDLARLLVAGVDVWLNTPEPPLEASGTSGMKAALNGVPSLSILDGWWIEGCIEKVTGWAIGTDDMATGQSNNRTTDADSLYAKLEQTVIPTFYHERQHFADMMRHTMALNGSFFNTQRMMQQYVLKAYFE